MEERLEAEAEESAAFEINLDVFPQSSLSFRADKQVQEGVCEVKLGQTVVSLRDV